MSDPYPQPLARDPRRPFVASPFTRLARTHAFSVAGDALFTVGLAGSVFFAVPLGEARWKVGLYLLLTFAPFAVAAPLIGPVIDRMKGGRRWVIIGSLVLRAFLCLMIVRDIAHLTFYLEAFLMLVLAKAYLISRAAVVPTTVRNDQELVEANSKLSLLSGVAAVVAGVPGAILLKLGGEAHGAQMAVGVAGVVFAVGAGFATRLPRVVVAEEKAGMVEKLELRSAGIRLAASAMELIRVAVGLLLLVLAFDFKNAHKPLWYLGAIGLMAQIGVLLGAGIAPRLRKAFSETQIIAGSLALTMAGAFIAAFLQDLPGAAILSLVLGATSGTAKQAFDALVQRDAPDANRGRSFARFETRFQLAWVIGAFLPVIIPFDPEVGFLLVGILMAGGLITFLIGQRRIAGGTYDWESPSQRLLREARSRVGPGRSGPEAAEPGDDGGRAAPAGFDRPLPPSPPVDPTAVAPPPPDVDRTAWEPPAGFVSHPLNEADPDATTVERPAPAAPRPQLFDGEADGEAEVEVEGAPVPPRPPSIDQPSLPFAGPDPTTADEVADPAEPLPFAEPRWRDSRR